MRRKQKSERQKEADKKAKERIKRFEENQKKPAKKEKASEADMACVEYWEKSVVNGDTEWQRRMYYYDKNDKKPKIY